MSEKIDNIIDKAIERFNKYNNSEHIYIYFYPADVDYLQEYFKTDISKDERTEVGNYILVPNITVPNGECVLGSQKIYEPANFKYWIESKENNSDWWEPKNNYFWVRSAQNVTQDLKGNWP